MTNQKNDLEALKTMISKIGIDAVHKNNPGWATEDRVMFIAADTLLSFNFDKNGELISLSWGDWLDKV